MATAILLPAPELQFCDADGKPYAGGSVATYVPGTSTPKQTWVDPGEAALNTNPIILDAAGRCIISGNYRIILRDAAGNLIYDQLSSTVVSDAMQPVVAAPTIADAQVLLGITGFATASDLAAAISTEQNARSAADTALGTRIDNEVTRAEAAEANLQSQIHSVSSGLSLSFEAGESATDSSGHAGVTFGTPFTSGIVKVVATVQNTGTDVIICTTTSTLTGFDCWTAGTGTGGTPVAAVRAFVWIAVGLR
jgi:hypothetical protein